jgi:hypothetical protein
MEKHKGYFAKGPWLTGTPVGLTRVRSVLGRWILIRRRSGRDGAGAAAGRRQRGGGGGGSPDFTRYRVSRLGSGSDRDREVESDVRNRSRGFRGCEIGRSGRATVSGGSETPARPCGRGRAGGREREMAGRHPHHDVVFRRWLCDGGEQGKRWCDELPRCGRQWRRWRARRLGF